jgi:hypothetical protein
VEAVVSATSRYAAILGTLLVAHNVADHVVQTDHQAKLKAEETGWHGAMAGHVGGYLATAEVALQLVGAVTGERPSWRRRLAGHLVSGATHAFLDRRWPVRRALQLTGSPRFADLQAPINGPYLTDQALHHGCLLLSALVMAR